MRFGSVIRNSKLMLLGRSPDGFDSDQSGEMPRERGPARREWMTAAPSLP
jgi:hypothetical protein